MARRPKKRRWCIWQELPVMQFGASLTFTLHHPGSPEDALHWAQTPEQALAQVDFLLDVALAGEQAEPRLSGELRVPVPLLGEVTLPFTSTLSTQPGGAALSPRPLPERRGWVEVTGAAQVGIGPAQLQGGQVQGSTPVELSFDFQAFLRLPDSGNLGGAAFEKMVRATAQRTIERVLAELPQQLQASMQ